MNLNDILNILLKKDDRQIKGLIGLTGDEFKETANDFEQTMKEKKQEEYEKRLKKGEDARKPGGGRKGKMKTVFEMLFYALFYIKCYPTLDVLGALFGVDRSVACRRIQQLLPILEKTLENTTVLPKREIKSMKELFETFPEIKDFFADGTERPIYRPKDKYEQTDNYSGKKKRHTLKNTIIVTEKKEILYLGPTNGGKKHDYTALKEEFLSNKDVPLPVVGILSPLNSPRIWVDLGFFGIEKDYPFLNVIIPIKKPKGGELNTMDKLINKAISSVRVIVENAIAGVKRFKMVTDVFRNKTADLKDKVMAIACGLWNYHVVYG